MLKSLNIENIAVIEKSEIEFSSGLNILTGETGAGKSIIIDAINAVLGERTSKELIRHGAENALVTAVFEDVNDTVIDKMYAMDLDVDPDEKTVIITRKINSNGKSSCRVNGTPCTVTMLKSLGQSLISIHGQHDSSQLLNVNNYYQFIDLMSTDRKELFDYQANFSKLLAIRRDLKMLTLDADTKDKNLELLDYQIKELTDADIKVGEREELKKRRAIIQNSHSIINALTAAIQAINGDDSVSGISTLLSSSKRELDAVSSVDKDIADICSDYDTLIDSVESTKDKLTAKLLSIDYSDDELEKIEDRLDLLYLFSNKYGETEQDMLNYLANAIEERDSIVNSDEEIEKLSVKYDEILSKTIACADILSSYRHGLAYKLQEEVKEQLEFLDMPKIEFIVDFQKGNLSNTGYDKIEFLISTNPGEPPKPLDKIASGGELSRIMLAIKNSIAKSDTVDTLIFDEIDTGVSGRASRKIGLMLKSVSKHSQVICVTHSAQIASVADNHLLIEKSFFEDRTYTNVTPLDFEGRKKELARIMGGLEITDSLLKSAEELLM